jgi:hypothetical protein
MVDSVSSTEWHTVWILGGHYTGQGWLFCHPTLKEVEGEGPDSDPSQREGSE